MLKAFVDDSGSDLKGPAYILTGYVSDVDSWDAFTKEWQALLDQHPRICYFKMSEAESRKGCFAGWDREDITAKIGALIAVINKYAKSRIECILWQEHYDVTYTWFLVQMQKQMDALVFSKVKRIFTDPYFLAFCLIMTDYAARLEMENSDEFCDFVFDTQGAVGKNCVKWWQR